jgi:histone H3/H4
MHRRNKK